MGADLGSPPHLCPSSLLSPLDLPSFLLLWLLPPPQGSQHMGEGARRGGEMGKQDEGLEGPGEDLSGGSCSQNPHSSSGLSKE